MGDEAEVRTFKEKMLFYTTAFFILLGTFSLFSFLFLVPFVIEPAFTTIFMQFDETPALCMTFQSTTLFGSKNCSWSSCREGCTKDIYKCTQIRVNYKLNLHNYTKEFNVTEYHRKLYLSETEPPPVKRTDRYERALRDNYDYIEGDNNSGNDGDDETSYDPAQSPDDTELADNTMIDNTFGLMGNDSEWYYGGARLFPNVKGCGYPPMLNCTIWFKRYVKEGTKFPCYYSKIDPGLVISELDMWQNTLNLVYSMAIPIPSFIMSIIYLTFAYFKIYNEDEEAAPLDKNAEGMAGGEDDELDNDEDIIEINESDEVCVDVLMPNGTTLISVNGPITSSSDINSFGHQLKVQMADEMSRESLDANVISNSGSIQGNLSKTMTTSISTPPGPTAAV